MDALQTFEKDDAIEHAPLATPRELARQVPATERTLALVRASRQAVADVLAARNPRRLAIVGPCSLHDPDAALEYAGRLRAVELAVRDRLVVVMRAYVQKPRTAVGWKGLVSDPRLDGSCDVAAGLELARRLLLAINEIGIPCASEIVDPATAPYLVDLLSWAAIGARTVESQTHRELASGLPMPVGLKNSTDGSLESAVNAMRVVGRPHSFVALGADGAPSVVRTRGNPDRHVVLRGGGGRPNYGRSDVERVASMTVGEGVARPVMIDCSHDNSAKDPLRQSGVLREVARRIGAEQAICGVLLESHLKPGKQSWQPGGTLEYGVSITDACIGFEETERLLHVLAEASEGRT
jgi:3-deoxy-7-phosphoheptulonate synthase